MEAPKKFIRTFSLAMLNLAVMASLRNLPIVAQYGLESSFYFVLVALVFLVPSALISAELASIWHKSGGIYTWVKEAFGQNWGFFAIWMQWVHNVTWFPAILSFSAASFAYLVYPSIALNNLYLTSFVLLGFWGFTLFNYFGLKHSSKFSIVGVIAGTILPGVFLIALGAAWVLGGKPTQILFNWGSLIPSGFDIQNVVLITSLFLSFGGLEVSAAYVHSVKNPHKSYPRAIAIAGILSFVLYILGALSLSILIPEKEISLVKGLIEGFYLFLRDFGLSYLLIPVGLLIVFGAIGELNAWIIGPVKALHRAASAGDLPPTFQRLNKHNTPMNLLWFQAIVVSIASLAFFILPDANSAFWILSAVSAQLYLVMYILMFLTAIRLRYTHPDVKRSYKVPFGKFGIWFFSLLGVASSFIAICVFFVPPSQIVVGNLFVYEAFLIVSLGVMCLIPYLIYRKRHPGWIKG